MSALIFGLVRLASSRGAHQGDPLGPAMFAAAIHPIIEELQGHLEGRGLARLDLMVFYLDDGVLAGPQQSVAVAVEGAGGTGVHVGVRCLHGRPQRCSKKAIGSNPCNQKKIVYKDGVLERRERGSPSTARPGALASLAVDLLFGFPEMLEHRGLPDPST